MARELGGAYLTTAYVEMVFSEPSAGAGIPVGALVKREGAYQLASTTDTKIAGVITSAEPQGGGVYKCFVLVMGSWSGDVFVWDATAVSWVPSNKSFAIQNPVYVV